MQSPVAMASDAVAPTPEERTALAEARRRLSMGYAAQAVDGLRQLLAVNPGLVEAWRLQGIALRGLRRPADAEAALRQAWRLAPTQTSAAVSLSELLVASDRAAEAREVLAPLVARDDADIQVLTAEAAALKALGRLEDAASAYERARQSAPDSAVAEHNLAGVLGELQRFAESEAAVARAFAKGLDAAETWLVHGRALQGLGDLDGAAGAYEEAIRRRPAFADALGDLAQLIWMRTEDIAQALAPLDGAMTQFPYVPDLRARKARLLEYAGDVAGAYAALDVNADASLGDPVIQTMAAHLASSFDPPVALAHAERAFALAPGQRAVVAGLAEAQLAAGAADAAALTAQSMRERWPLDQHGIGLLAVAWRLTGDPRYRELYDYEHMVRAYRIDPPDGWDTLESYLADLAAALTRLHGFRTHPVGQSLRHGSQTQQNLARSDDPAIRAFFQAIDGPIRRHIAWLGAGEDPLRCRAAADYAYSGIWSVLLRPGGFHISHLHQMGWLSSAFYVALPAAIDRGREGWIEFGRPGVPTEPPLDAEHAIKPEPGLLVLFPSYMWHGTVPFSGEDPRLTIAFDLTPA